MVALLALIVIFLAAGNSSAAWPHWPSQTSGIVNPTTGLPTISGNDWNSASTRVYHLSALSFRPVNGSSCAAPVYDRAANELPSTGGTVHPYLTCTDSANDEITTVIPLVEESGTAGWEGVLQVTGIASYVDVDGAPATNPPTGTVMGFNVAADCNKLPNNEDDTYGGTQTLAMTLTVNESFAVGTTANVTASGTCTGASQATPVLLKIRFVVNTALFNCPAGCATNEMRLNYIIIKLIAGS